MGSLSSFGGAVCCDVSWISKFPEEKEILFNRGMGLIFKTKIISDNRNDNLQIISLNLTNDVSQRGWMSAFCRLPYERERNNITNDIFGILFEYFY